MTREVDAELKGEQSPERIWIGGRAKYLLQEQGSCLCYSRPDLEGLEPVEYIRADSVSPEPNYPAAIELLRSLRNVSEEEAQEQRETWAILERDLNQGKSVVAECDSLKEQVEGLREALGNILQCFANGAAPDISIIDAARTVLKEGEGK